ncbi:MAG: MFS transporter [Anaerolineales bacterium]|nr:MFS transporter [Anaerolineales bacterium]
MQRISRWVLGGSVDANGWYLCLEIFWSSIYGVASGFTTALAVRLGASNTAISWMTSGAALSALLIVPLAGRFLQRRAKRRRLILFALFLSRASALLFIVTPLVRQSSVAPGLLVILISLLATVPMHVFNVGFPPFLSEAIPLAERAKVFAARNTLASVTGISFSVIFGWALVAMPFPLNYQVMFFIGFIFATLSSYYLARVRVEEPALALEPPPAPVPAAPVAPRPPLRQRLGSLWAELQAERGFVRFNVNTFLHAFGMWMAGPLYTLYLLRELGLGENWLGILGAVTSVSAILGYQVWRRVIERWGEPNTLKLTMLLLGAYPLLLGLSGWPPVILLAGAVHGLVSAGVSLAHFNTQLRVLPPAKGHAFTALNMTFMNSGIMVAPLIGVALANRFGLGVTLVACGLVAILGATSFYLWPVEAPALRPGARAAADASPAAN